MTDQAIINGLYSELLFVAMILLSILLFNNIVLYKQKFKDNLSLMLLLAVVMCGSELLWTFCDGYPQLNVLTYIGICGYMITFVSFVAMLNCYILNRLDRLPKSKWLTVLLYIVPLGVFSLLCISTPWTHCLVKLDEAGILQKTNMCDILVTAEVADSNS